MSTTHPPGAHRCTHCHRPFPTPHLRSLHHARHHAPKELTPAEAHAVEEALERESRALHEVRRHLRAGLVSLPVLLVAFASLVITAYSGSSPALAFLLVPGLTAFAALFYGMTYAFGARDGPERASEP